jgi:hypothetical protein
LHDAFPDRYPLSPTLANFAAGDDGIVVREHAPSTVDEIHERVLAALADEVARLLDDGVVASVQEVDACMILGAGYPFFLGGITRHLDDTGISERVLGRRLSEHVALAS